MKHLIIDTDPGVDDALALLYALSLPTEFQILLVSLTFGNVSLKQCFRNCYTIFDAASRYGIHDAGKVPLALGESCPLVTKDTADAAHFHGGDGLGGIHTSDNNSTPSNWEDVFTSVPEAVDSEGQAALPFKIQPRPAYQEILHVLQRSEPQTVTIVAIGPLSNIAKAAMADPIVFSRVKEIVIMGGAIDVPGNANPYAEFNIFADPEAAAITFALTNPRSSMTLGTSLGGLDVSALRRLTQPVKITLLPLDITRQHHFRESEWEDACQGSRLADWVRSICASSFRPLPGLSKALVPHDALCLWYVLNADEADPSHGLFKRVTMDLRVETRGEWTKGMCCVDGRLRTSIPVPTEVASPSVDPGSWLDRSLGNSVGVLKETPGRKEWVEAFTQALFPTEAN